MFKTQVIGHLGKDAIVSEANGKKVINFSVAYSESYTDRTGQKVNSTTWINCAWWTESTKVAMYLQKGTQVYVEGKPSVDSYRNNQGQVMPLMNLRVESLQLLGRKDQSQSETQASYNAQRPSTGGSSASNDLADDLPF